MTQTFETTVTRTIDASRQSLFEAWLDPEALRRFMCPAPGVVLGEVAVDARVGGTFVIVMLAGDKEMPHRGEYLVIERYHRLAFSWLSEHAGPGSEVTITFEEVAPSQTLLTLRHVGLGTTTARDNHQAGWTRIVQLLGERP